MTMSAAQMTAALAQGAAHGLTLAAERVRAIAVPLTPLEYGDLRSSLTPVPATADDLESAVVSDLPYAVRQHEDLTLRHDDGGAKFLETAVLNSVRDIEQILGQAARRALEG